MKKKQFAVAYFDTKAGELKLELVEAEDEVQAVQTLDFIDPKWFEGIETPEELTESLDHFGIMVKVRELP